MVVSRDFSVVLSNHLVNLLEEQQVLKFKAGASKEMLFLCLCVYHGEDSLNLLLGILIVYLELKDLDQLLIALLDVSQLEVGNIVCISKWRVLLSILLLVVRRYVPHHKLVLHRFILLCGYSVVDYDDLLVLQTSGSGSSGPVLGHTGAAFAPKEVWLNYEVILEVGLFVLLRV